MLSFISFASRNQFMVVANFIVFGIVFLFMNDMSGAFAEI